MFHTVSQFQGAEEEEVLSPGTGASNLPMFREAPLSSFRKGSSCSIPHSSQGGSSLVAPATASPSSGVNSGPVSGGGGRSAPRRALRSRRSAGIEMRAMGGGDNQPTFAGPDDSGFGEGSVFRWDATVADEASAEGDDKDEDGDVPESVRRSVKRGGRVKLRFPPEGGEEAGHIRGRSAEKPWYVILPESRTHQVLDHLGDLLTMYVVVAIPLFVSFQHIENMHAEDTYAFNIGVDLLFLADLAARFLTAYYDEHANRMVYEPRCIARHYASGLLVPDLIASLPLTIILGVRVFSIANKVTRLARIPQTMRLIRSIKMLSEEAEGTNHKNILLAAYNLVKVILYILLVMHWVACGWHLLADVEDADMSWIVKDGLEDAAASKLYVTSVYWTVTTLSTVGYGDIFASTIAERTYCILVMLTGATMYALAIGAVSHIIATVVARHSNSRRIERHAEAFICMHSLPPELSSEIMRTLNISGETEVMANRRAQNTLELLPSDVRTWTLMCIYRSQIARIAFLKNRKDTDPVFVTSLARSLHAHIYPKAGEEVVFENTTAEEVLFLVRGRAVVMRRGVEVGRMNAGSCFGATAALRRCRRKESVTCVTECDMYTVEGSVLRLLARSFPGPMAELRAESERVFASTGDSAVVRGGAAPTLEGHHVPWKNGATSMVPSPRPERGFTSSADMVSRFPLTDNDAPGRRRRSDPTYVRDEAEPLSVRGSLVASAPGFGASTSTISPLGVFRDSGSVRPALETQRSIRALSRCLLEAAGVEAEVWDRLHQLTDSLRTMKHCLNECGVAREQVLDGVILERDGSRGEGLDAVPLVNAGSSKS